MIRGWGGDSSKNPFDDDADTESSQQQNAYQPPSMTVVDGANSNNDPSHNAANASTQEAPTTTTADQEEKDTGMFRDWDRANLKYKEENKVEEEITFTEDPLASPGNSSVNSGFGGWSVGPGMGIDKESVGNPFDADDDDDYDDDEEDDDDDDDNRSSSPRQGHLTSHGLSMVKEEEDEGDDDSGDSANGAKKTMFDDVDLEAFPQNLPTSSNNNGYSHPHNRNQSTSNTRGNIANRVLQELQTNPNLKFKFIVGLSMMLVASCLIAIAVAASNGKNHNQPVNDRGGDNGAVDLSVLLDSLESITDPEPTSSPVTKVLSSSPTVKPTTKSPSSSPTGLPTYDPTTYPTLMTLGPSSGPITSHPTSYPTEILTTMNPSFSPTTNTPTYSPSYNPVTLTPTRDCTDDNSGEFMTYNDKSRDCTWLDNEYNGAKSTRKDLNCLDSDIGDACKYTCRLYNGCMTYLLSSLPEYTADNDVSIGNSCDDKVGSFMSNGNVPRECMWLEEDMETAPAKKNVNCGTPHVARTELGIMCPGSCAGYNDCIPTTSTAGGGMVDVSGGVSIEQVSPYPILGLNSGQAAVADGDTTEDDGSKPTSFPTLFTSEEPTAWSTDAPTSAEERCQDKDGEFLTHMGTLRQCRWFNRDDAEEKKELNCGITEIGLNCLESCPCEAPIALLEEKLEGVLQEEQIEDGVTGTPTVDPTAAPTSLPEFDETGEILTLAALADTSVSYNNEDENFGDTKRLNVVYDPDGNSKEKQSLLLFGLNFVAQSFGDIIGKATLRIYSVTGSSDSGGGVIFKKMVYANWTEDEVTWSTVPGGDGLNEPVIAFVDSLDSNSWYDIDVTAAVRDALENDEPRMGIRIVSDEAVDVYFASRERVNEPPLLIVDSRTFVPTPSPTNFPTYIPTISPIMAIDCMDKKGKFDTHIGESEPCSWLGVGNGSLKKAFNCQDQSEAALFCQAQCSAYNGCDDLTCEDMSGTYQSHTGWTAQCSWLLTGQGTLKLEQNCGTEEYPITELGKRCQAACGEYNGCGIS
mmetsp:Transcript_20130/g.43719  ORF Transcript_20130/g.43719 Transcript_20130/m.43719 type:complete len:1029 (-) Transcript_20130:138-3224(-)|eukprot:CAMPEP_0172300444 /NCGR_PEP_ID=MMETSP1058-20130122/2534_1 /TAXON_ID=83371 /ORGANISM="Detonula confervacea, Strain CCMP 353" /LENGTH=1028 /DNA_ID=CAMNT_0013010221 /DNA_START=144 /DNA_END=3230 /DNA_ORIENTATION=-